MEKTFKIMLISIFTVLITGSIQNVLAEDITDVFKPIAIKNSYNISGGISNDNRIMMGIDDEFEEPNLYKTQEEYNVMFLYIISLSYDIIRIYYSFHIFVDNYRIILIMLWTMYGLERYLIITSNELKKIVVVMTSFILIYDVFHKDSLICSLN